MVRVLAIADEVVESLWGDRVCGLAPDLVIAAGDLPWDYLEFMASRLNVPLVFVPGNHDPELSPAKPHRSGLFLHAGLPVAAPRPQGALNADQAVLDVAGLRIAGLGGCVKYRPGPHQYTQREHARRGRQLLRAVRRVQRRSPGDVDILVTHAPPLGLGDDDDRPHEGIEALHHVLEDLQPRLHLHGHIHPHGRTMRDRTLGRTVIRNVIPYRVIDLPVLGDRHPAAARSGDA
jgi:Icc-related predicted phosphoesterase